MEWWYVILVAIPIVNISVGMFIADGIAKRFGESRDFGLRLFLLSFIFLPILAYGKAEYMDDRTLSEKQTGES